MSAPAVTITLIHTPRPRLWRGKRHQPWRWIARATNGRILAASSEAYTNRADAVEAIWLLFGTGSEARLLSDEREHFGSHYLLRGADLEPPADCGLAADGDDDWPLLGEVLG